MQTNSNSQGKDRRVRFRELLVGEVPTRCSNSESLRSDAMERAVDIDASSPARKITIHLPTH